MKSINKNTPIDFEVVLKSIENSGVKNIGTASIREMCKLINIIEEQTNKKFIRMEMGIPGYAPNNIALNAEIEALKRGVAATYSNIEGFSDLKQEMSKFVKNFLNVDVNSSCCLPVCGSMQGTYACFLMLTKIWENRDTVLLIDPGFPVHKQQLNMLNIKSERFDIFEYRGDKLKEKLESYLKKGNIHSLIYSNPNNPSWICLTEYELKIIGELATKYDVIVIEDLAYFGMDIRKDISKPGEPPYQSTVAKYTSNYILLISSSKIFNYAGQRISIMAISNELYNREYSALVRFFKNNKFGHNMLFEHIYCLSSGTTHSGQYALYEILKAVNKGEYNFVNDAIKYSEKAKVMKDLFMKNGFYLVYDNDMGDPLADGFFFTVNYPGFTGEELLERLIYYGISAISLKITGSDKEGIRVCVSFVQKEQFKELEKRLQLFNKHNS